MSHFDRERIPERVVHAKGAGESAISGCVRERWGGGGGGVVCMWVGV